MRRSTPGSPDLEQLWLWSLVVPSFGLFWALGFAPAWWLVAPVLLMSARRFGRKSLPADAIILVSIGVFLTASLIINVAAGEVSSGRIAGAAYSALVWVSAGTIAFALGHASAKQLFVFVRGLILLGAAQGFLSALAVMLHPSPISTLQLPAMLLQQGAGGPGAAQLWAIPNLAYTDFFGGGIVRSSGLMGTAAWSGGFACLILLLLVLYRRQLLAFGMTRLFWLSAVVLNLASLHLSYSRVSWAILIGLTGIYFFFRIASRSGKGGTALAVVATATSLLLALSLLPWREFLLSQDSLRPGSSTARFFSYTQGLDAAFSNGPWSALAGSGAKPFLEELGRGVGSESTYVSLLVRGGLAAGLLFTCFLLVRIRRAALVRDWAGVMVALALAIHALVEDLDVGTLTVVLVLIPPLASRLVVETSDDAGLQSASTSTFSLR